MITHHGLPQYAAPENLPSPIDKISITSMITTRQYDLLYPVRENSIISNQQGGRTMVTIINERIKTSLDTTNIEEVLEQIGVPSAPPSPYALPEDGTEILTVLDEGLLYEMGYTLSELPGNIHNNTHDFCSAILAKIVHSGGNICMHDLQNQASIYLAGYHAGLKAR